VQARRLIAYEIVIQVVEESEASLQEAVLLPLQEAM
jgi:hypothetical protein